MTLIEVLVAMGLFAVLGSILLGVALATSRVADSTQTLADRGEDARMGMERVTRELRQAERISSVNLPITATDETRFVLWVDFDGNGCIGRYVADPEAVTYVYKPTTKELTVSAQIKQSDGTLKSVAGVIARPSTFLLELNSSAWQYDADQNGTTTGRELNSSSVGDGNLNVWTTGELAYVDLVRVSEEMADSRGGRTVRYSTDVNLRNRDRESQMQPCP
jgi:type II secretory pathway pseudopilin PulG